MQLSNELLDKYYSCLRSSVEFNNHAPMQRFKEEHKQEFLYINNCYAKRVKIAKCCEALKHYKQDIFFGALTFDEKHDKSTIRNKRVQAQKHLNNCFACWVMVEEYGEENGRYHIHFFGVYKRGKTHNDFHSGWHSIANIKPLKHKDIRYVTDYTSKQCPRVRQSKSMLELVRNYKKARSFDFYEFDSIAVNYDFEALIGLTTALNG